MSRHDDILATVEQAIVDGKLRPGDRLPTVREMSGEYNVSAATVAAAYRSLQRRGLTRGEVGRGTYVADSPPRSEPTGRGGERARRTGMWRRRAVSAGANRLKTLYPDALDCTSGKPDPAVLPLASIRRAWTAAVAGIEAADLQYATPEPSPQLAAVLERRLRGDGITVQGSAIVVGSSAQQLMVLSQSIVKTLAGTGTPVMAVEEPGFQTVFDALERHGARLRGLELDEHGVVPTSLDRVLSSGDVRAVLFTPRAQNPTGSSWTPSRRLAIANVLARHADVLAIEDDQFADLASSSAGSLLADPRLAERVIYIRSFSKTIAPDLRLAVGVTSPRLRNLLAEAKSLDDGWSPRLSQHALAYLLEDPELDAALEHARLSYAARRSAALDTLRHRLAPIGAKVTCTDGLNVWIELPIGIDAAEVVAHAAAAGVLLVSGEPFFIQPGHDRWIRMSISQISLAEIEQAAHRLADAALSGSTLRPSLAPL